MDDHRPVSGVLFSGDLGDPWVRALRDAIPGPVATLDGETLPEAWPVAAAPGVVVLHRGALTVAEHARIRRLREGAGAPRIVLVVGPHVRYHQVMAWTGLVDVVLPEATAGETIARHLGPAPARRAVAGRRPAVAVASGQFELARLIEEALAAAGYRPSRVGDDPARGPEPWVVWDVPVLEPDWPDRLARASRRRGVVALIGLADRRAVAVARAHGALGCLDLPSDPDDLVFVLDRLTASRPGASRLWPDRPPPRRSRPAHGGARAAGRPRR